MLIKEIMRKNLTFVSLLVALVAAMGLVSAFADIDSVEFKGIELDGSQVVSVSPGEVVPIWVQFTATADVDDVVLSAETGGRDSVSAELDSFDVRTGKTYSKLLKLKLPEDTDDLIESFVLRVELSASNEVAVTTTYEINFDVEKNSYDLEVLSVDYSTNVAAGNPFPVSVVVKNVGSHRADDVYVIASIPALGVSARGYVSDLVVTEGESDYEDEEDSAEEVVYLSVPEGTESGIYELTVEVYNRDSSVEVSKLLSVSGVDPEEEENGEVLEEGEETGMSTSVVALTVILVIIFVVLLAVLVVLLTKKEKPIEEVETSYY